MTTSKHLKRLVRERMARTGESYTTARRHVLARRPEPDSLTPAHLPGLHPESAGLRVLLAHAGLTRPDGAPLSEALTLTLLGGVGAGAMGFHYAQMNFSNFFVAGRHLWQDNVAALTQAAARLGLTPLIRESSSPAKASQQLDAALAEGPALAWVDMAPLGYRGFPAHLEGAGYHLVVVQRVEGGQAWVSDLADEPVALPTEALAKARARIRKDKQRLMSLPAVTGPIDWAGALRASLAAGHAGLAPGKPRTFNLSSWEAWAKDLHGGRGKESWPLKFPRGTALWQVLCSSHQFIEKYHTGGGLLRPLYAEGLREAGELLGDAQLIELSERYAALGQAWSALADALLPAGVAAFDEARALIAQREQLYLDRGAEGAEDVRVAWARARELSAQAGEAFPLS